MSKKSKILSIIMKVVTIVSALVGTMLSASAGQKTFMGGTKVFMFFTIQSNVAIAIVCIVGMVLLLKNIKLNHLLNVLKLVATISITLTGVVFCIVLAPTLGDAAWNLQNVLTHVIVPLFAIVDYFIVCRGVKFSKVDPVYVTIPPILYAIYAGIGYVLNWEFMDGGYNYPYFFLNWGSKAGAFEFTSEGLPFIGCAYWIIGIAGFLIGIGYIYTSCVNIGLNKKIEK